MDLDAIEIVNPVPVEEWPGWLATMTTTFFGDPHTDEFRRGLANFTRFRDPGRAWGARSGGRMVATLATMPRTITVPGPAGTAVPVPADALTNVTVAATHRRRGLLTRMLTTSLAAAKDRGDALSILVAAEWPIYGRFGYAPAVQDANYSYFPRHVTAKVTPSGTGTVRQVDLAEAGRVGAEVYGAATRTRAGQVDRPAWWWGVRHGLDGYQRAAADKTPTYLVREGAGGPDGFLAWRAVHDFDLAGNLAAIEVSDLVAANDDAYRDLWAYLSGIDAVGEVTLTDRPVDEPVRWLLPDGRALRRTYSGDHVWVRLLDVPAALAARCYAVPGRLVIEVVGDPAGYATGRFALDGGPDGAHCASTDAAPDLRLSQRALAGAYLGGYRLAEIAIGGGVEQLRTGAVATADAMFATGLAPWNPTGF